MIGFDPPKVTDHAGGNARTLVFDSDDHNTRVTFEVASYARDWLTFRIDWLYNGEPDILPMATGKHDAGGTSFEAEDILNLADMQRLAWLLELIFEAVRSNPLFRLPRSQP